MKFRLLLLSLIILNCLDVYLSKKYIFALGFHDSNPIADWVYGKCGLNCIILHKFLFIGLTILISVYLYFKEEKYALTALYIANLLSLIPISIFGLYIYYDITGL